MMAFTAPLLPLFSRWTSPWGSIAHIDIHTQQQHIPGNTSRSILQRRSCVYAFPPFVIQILILEMLILFVTTQRNCGTFTFTTPTWISLELNELKLWHRSSVTLVYFRVTSTLNTLFYILNLVQSSLYMIMSSQIFFRNKSHIVRCLTLYGCVSSMFNALVVKKWDQFCVLEVAKNVPLLLIK